MSDLSAVSDGVPMPSRENIALQERLKMEFSAIAGGSVPEWRESMDNRYTALLAEPPGVARTAVTANGVDAEWFGAHGEPGKAVLRPIPCIVRAIWKLAQWFRGGQRHINILQILFRAGMINSAANRTALHDLSDLLLQAPLEESDLLHWKAFDRAIEVGYRYTNERLAEWKAKTEAPSSAEPRTREIASG